MNGTILIVDDTPSGLYVLCDVLHKRGFRVIVAESGEAALREIEAVTPDLILLDLMMPGMDGFSTLSAVREREALAGVPVIFMTGIEDVETKVRALGKGAVDYVTKPFHHEEVMARIEIHLTNRNLRNRLEAELVEKSLLIEDLKAFGHTVAHDLKTPLAGINAATEILEVRHGEELPEKSRKNLLLIKRTCFKMSSIIKELLLLASVREQEIELVPVDLVAIAREAWMRLGLISEQYAARITFPRETLPALGYGPWIEEVIANLLSNALKYGGQPPVIEVSAHREPEGARLSVRDNGRGLTAEERQRILAPFSKLEPEKDEGHGLGLPIVCRILEKLRGRLQIESVPGEGSTFSVLLPAQTRSIVHEAHQAAGI